MFLKSCLRIINAIHREITNRIIPLSVLVVKEHNVFINSFDIDGVCYINKDVGGVYPGPNDIIITGRSYEEIPETIAMLRRRGIINEVFFNPLPFDQKTRESSGHHKADVLNRLYAEGHKVMCHFEDDDVQADVIRKLCPQVKVVMLHHDLTEKENIRHE